MDEKVIKILIVEDETALSTALKNEFKTNDKLKVHTARDGGEGLDLAKSEHPDLILLDIIMPVVDGIEMLKRLREDEWGKTARVVMLTNLDPNDLLDANINEYNVSEYIVKSEHELEDIVRKVKKILGFQD